jgi:hypothetical protein
MRTFFLVILFTGQFVFGVRSQTGPDEILPVRGLCIAAPVSEGVDQFIRFINDELIPRKVNTLVLRVDYRYAYTSHPELIAENALSKEQVKRIVKACKKGGIKIVPQVNMLGHQSWYTNVGKLLEVYPQFNETPDIPLDKKVKWPNKWGLYCLSYCPLHPDLHKITFEIIDEIVEVFEAEAFHAGMDEVFYIGMDERCKGKSNAELFAGEVTAIRDHLAEKNKKLWIWGDRLIDGETTGMGMWEASTNNTHKAIDMIPKDVVINDWHYERPDPTAAYFALKGFQVITSPWRKPGVTKEQLKMMLSLRKNAPEKIRDRYQGMLQTVWTSAENAIDQFYGRKKIEDPDKGNWVVTFKELFDEINKPEITK